MSKTQSMLGLEKGIVRLVPYQPTWRAFFEVEALRLRSCLGKQLLKIEHIGSTAIEGMHAKPIIDIIAAIRSLNLATSFIPLVESIGYIHKNEDDIPTRLFFVKKKAGLNTHHLSLCETTSEYWKSLLLFRDYLRGNPHAAEEYRQLKYELARRFPTDRGSYLAGKHNFIIRILAAADSR
jgi:GrpB-like predicted nucleotidyltransferase (UPF0157 family)